MHKQQDMNDTRPSVPAGESDPRCAWAPAESCTQDFINNCEKRI